MLLTFREDFPGSMVAPLSFITSNERQESGNYRKRILEVSICEQHVAASACFSVHYLSALGQPLRRLR